MLIVIIKQLYFSIEVNRYIILTFLLIAIFHFLLCRTIMKQEAVVIVFGLSFGSYCEKLITETYENNSRKVRDFNRLLYVCAVFISLLLIYQLLLLSGQLFEQSTHAKSVTRYRFWTKKKL